MSGWLALAAALAVAVGASAYAWQLQQRVRTLEARLDGAEQRAVIRRTRSRGRAANGR